MFRHISLLTLGCLTFERPSISFRSVVTKHPVFLAISNATENDSKSKVRFPNALLLDLLLRAVYSAAVLTNLAMSKKFLRPFYLLRSEILKAAPQ